ncbi:MAG: Phosphocarrier protein HPr [Chlamydiae bacterium]|nr:Phosphocarrier protein HPr [Chlamydiota bacterium]
MKTLEHAFLVQNNLGLHARPATAIAKSLQSFQAKVTFSCNSLTVDAKQVMSLLLLEATENTLIRVKVEGSDADLALKGLLTTIENIF